MIPALRAALTRPSSVQNLRSPTSSNTPGLQRSTSTTSQENSKGSEDLRVLKDETYTLPSGHNVSYSDVGPSTAQPLFFLHGFPSSRYEGIELAPLAHKLNVRFITPDRPGVGLSTHEPYRRLLDYPSQISALAKGLGLENGYRVMGGSGGGPYALACAKALPTSELKGVGVLAGVGPLYNKEGTEGMRFGNRAFIKLYSWVPGLVGWSADRSITRRIHDPDPNVFDKWLAQQIKWSTKVAKMSQKEKDMWEKDGDKISKAAADILREHFRQGAQGMMRDGQVLTDPWGFKLEDVERKGVKFYYGTEDRNTPASIGRAMAAKMKSASYHEYPAETHFTLMEKFGEEIFKDMMND